MYNVGYSKCSNPRHFKITPHGKAVKNLHLNHSQYSKWGFVLEDVKKVYVVDIHVVGILIAIGK